MSQIVLDTSWRTVEALCISLKRVPDQDLVVAPLFRLYQSVGRGMDLVHWAIDKDIGSGVKEAALLFRVPSTATRLLRCVFFSAEGTEYLRAVLVPILKKLKKTKTPVELDPNRLPYELDEAAKAEMLKASARVVLLTADSVLQAASKTVDSVPLVIRKFLLYARNTFMGAQHAAGCVNEDAATKLVVASLFFLRFIIPAIVSPVAFQVLDAEPSPEVQRALVLVGKVLQCTASGVDFDGTKESYMSTCGPFVVSNQATVLKLFKTLIDAQAIGMRELKNKGSHTRASRKLGARREATRALQEEMESAVSVLRVRESGRGAKPCCCLACLTSDGCLLLSQRTFR